MPVMLQVTELFSYCHYLLRSLKRLFTNKQLNFLNDNNIFYKYRSGFRNNHSTDVFLSFLNDKILKGFDNGPHVGMILTDLQKTFDTLNHKIHS